MKTANAFGKRLKKNIDGKCVSAPRKDGEFFHNKFKKNDIRLENIEIRHIRHLGPFKK